MLQIVLFIVLFMFSQALSLRLSKIPRISRKTLLVSSSVGLLFLSMSGMSSNAVAEEYDSVYPGTAVRRMNSARDRVRSLGPDQLNGEWEQIRKQILWAGGLKDLTSAVPGAGYTGHSFNDFNHCDLTTMLDQISDSENQGRVAGIAHRNPLGNGIRVASLTELGPGGSWSTCMIGCNQDPPNDVAHVQFQSRIAFKLVWAPPTFNTFVLVDDDGKLLAQGTASGSLPAMRERQKNYAVVQGSKYASAADAVAQRSATVSGSGL